MIALEWLRHVAIAADTPQIDTALDSIVANSSSTRSFRANQKENVQTLTTTTSACAIPRSPARAMSSTRIPAPSTTSPVLM